jgi:endonuclease-3
MPARKSGKRPKRAVLATASRAEKLIEAVSEAVGISPLPSVSKIAREKRDPFRILVSTVISLRTKDEVTDEASRRLFELADTPEALSRLNTRTIQKAIYPAGFYKTKARVLKDISRRLVDQYGGRVPDSVDELLTFKGVGRKTATLVVSLGYGKPAICVDTHVHRVSNRLGLVETANPTETEHALADVLPRRYWIGYNELLVRFGQQICKPISPHCTTCPVLRLCPQIGVGRHR